MKGMMVLGAVVSMTLSVSAEAKSSPPPETEEQRIESITEQIAGKVVGVNVVEYGGGKLMLPVVQSESQMCVSIINSMNAKVENPLKAGDYDYQIGVHCDETAIEKRKIRDIEYSSTKSKGFERSYLIELDKGIVMHSAKYTSGELKVWPATLFEEFLVQNDKEIKTEVEALTKREHRRASRLAKVKELAAKGNALREQAPNKQ